MALSSILFKDDLGNSVVPTVIDGRQIVLPSSASFPVINAKTQSIVHYAQTASVETTTRAIESAGKAFKVLKGISVIERRRLLLRAAEIFRNRIDEAISRDMAETASIEAWSASFTKTMPDTIEEIATTLSTVFKGEIHNSYSGKTSLVYKEPVGPVLVIPPWNAATTLVTIAVTSALAAGCSVVLKGSELSPWSHHFVAEVFHEAGFPPGALNFIVADRPAAALITETLIAHPLIRRIEFIGSAPVGKLVGQVAAKHLKPIAMELGDQSPAIVLEDANLHSAAFLCALGVTAHHGQVCFGTERIIVHKSVKDEFVKLLREAMKNTPFTQHTAATNALAEKTKRIIDEAVAAGAEFLIGDGEMTGPATVNSSILINVSPETTMYNHEVFGPTATLTVVDSDEAAVAEANSRAGGLSASIFTGNFERGLRLARELEFGSVSINDMTIAAEIPGPVTSYKGSGWGSSSGKYGIEKFVFNKSVTLKPTQDVGAH